MKLWSAPLLILLSLGVLLSAGYQFRSLIVLSHFICFLVAVLFLVYRVSQSGSSVMQQARRSVLLKVAGLIALFIGGVLVLEKLTFQLDFSRDSKFSLSAALERSLRELDEETTVTVYQAAQYPVSREERDRLSLVQRAASKRLRIEYIDPVVDFAAIDNSKRREGERFVVRGEQSGAVVPVFGFSNTDLLEAFSSFSRASQSVMNVISAESETALRKRFGTFFALLEQRKYQVNLIDSFSGGKEQPGSVWVVIIDSSQAAVNLETELGKLWESGASALVLCEPASCGKGSFFSTKGLLVGDNFVVDRLREWQGAAGLGVQPVIDVFADAPPLGRFRDKASLLFERATSIRRLSSSELDDNSYRPLVFSSKDAWGETSLEALERGGKATIQLSEDDHRGPLSVASLIRSAESGSEMIVFGDSTWLENAFVRLNANFSVVFAALDWLAYEATSAPAGDAAEVQLLSSSVLRQLVLWTVVVPELIILTLILGVYFRRRRTAIAV